MRQCRTCVKRRGLRSPNLALRYTPRMTSSRCIGLVGGLGVGAGLHYYSKLAEAYERRGAKLDLVIVNAEIPEAMRFVSSGDRAGLAAYLAGFLRRLSAAGAELAVIPAVTPHICINELRPIAPLPILCIFDSLNSYLQTQPIRGLAVFGTRYVMQSDLYGMVPGIEFVHARPDELDEIHRIYMALAQSGKGSEEVHLRLTEFAQMFLSRDGADAILFAGTDLALVFNEANTQFPAIDCAALHVDAIVAAALGREKA
jgi:aspartate racemase